MAQEAQQPGAVTLSLYSHSPVIWEGGRWAGPTWRVLSLGRVWEFWNLHTICWQGGGWRPNSGVLAQPSDGGTLGGEKELCILIKALNPSSVCRQGTGEEDISAGQRRRKATPSPPPPVRLPPYGCVVITSWTFWKELVL